MVDREAIRDIQHDIIAAAQDPDSDLSPEEVRKLIGSLDDIIDAAEVIDESPPIADLREGYDRAETLRLLVDHLEASDGPPASYIDDFIRALTDPPYTVPSSLFEPEGAQMITVEGPRGHMEEQAVLALQTLFPGSTSFRYPNPVKVRTGHWANNMRADLASNQDLTEDPLFQVERDGRNIDVHGVRRLRTITLDSGSDPTRGRPICPVCLAHQDDDEACNHQAQPIHRAPSSYGIIRQVELGRDYGGVKQLRAPLNELIDRVRYARRLSIGTAVVGFERNSRVNNATRSVIVDYTPAIGSRIETRGLVFTLNLDDDIISELANRNHLRRDMAVQILARRLATAFRDNGLPIYNHEIVLSALMRAMGFESDLTMAAINRNLLDDDLPADVITEIGHEEEFYEDLHVDHGRINSALQDIQYQIDDDEIRSRLRQSLMHALAHQILLASTVTAGAESRDLDYLLTDDNEIIIFDTDSGGNGSTEMIFEFLSGDEEFDVQNFRINELHEDTFRPRYFDETLFESLLPCVNSVAEHAYLFMNISPPDRRLQKWINRLEEKEDTHSQALERLRTIGSNHTYPASIGYHAVDYSTNPREGDRFKELARVCVHGCPECTIIGTNCTEGQFIERYSISKRAQNLYFRHILDNYQLDHDADSDDIIQQIRDNEIALISGTCSNEQDCRDIRQTILDTAASIDGDEVNGDFVKFAGFWLDALPNNNLEYSAMLVAM